MPMHLGPVVSLLFVGIASLPASADPPDMLYPSGITGGVMTAVTRYARPMWVDDRGFVITGAEGASVPPECWRISGTSAEPGPYVVPASDPPVSGELWHLAVGAGEDPLVLRFRPDGNGETTLAVFQVTCDGEPTLLGEVAAGAAVFGVGAQSSAWPLHDGVVHLVTLAGELVRLDLRGAVPTWTELDRGGLAVGVLGLAPGGAVWMTVSETSPVGTDGTGFATIDDAGLLTVLRPEDPGLRGVTSIVAAAELGGVLIGTPSLRFGPHLTQKVVGIVPSDASMDWSTRLPPWPAAGDLAQDGFVPAADGSVWLRTASEQGYYDLRRLGLDAAIADFDRDGLSAALEATLGTSDLAYDSDGDGFNDGLEAGLLASDPAQSASHPAAPPVTGGMRFAPSTFINEAVKWQNPTGAPVTTSVCPAGLPMPGDPVGVCTHLPDLCPPGPDGEDLDCVAYGVTPVTYTRDGHYGFATAVGSSGSGVRGINRFDTTSGENRTFISPAAWAPFGSNGLNPALYALSSEALAMVSFQRVVRWVGSEPLIIIDMARTDCPIVRSAAELAACDSAGLVRPEGTIQPLGYAGDRFILRIGTGYFAVSDADVAQLADGYGLADGMEIEHLVTLPGGGVLALAEASVPGQLYAGTFALDALLRPLATTVPFVGREAFGPWAERGFLGRSWLEFKYVYASGPCESTPDAPDPECGTHPGGLIYEGRHVFSIEWVPVPDAIAPGEVLLASQRTYRRPPPNHGEGPTPLGVWQPDGSYEPSEGSKRWPLWRVTALGAVTPWLDIDTFKAATDDNGRASLASTPLGEVSALRVSPDGTRVCLVEGERVWELELIAGTLGAITLVEAGAGAVGCAYDADGRLARLAASPSAIRVGDVSLSVPGAPAEMVRAGAHWLVRDASGAAHCVDDAGATHALAVTMVGLAETGAIDAGVVFIDAAGDTWIGRAPCTSDTFPEEDVDQSHRPVRLWELLYTDFYLQDLTAPASKAALAMRPDGLVLVSGGELDIYPATLLFRLYPSFHPRAGVRLPELDRYRRESATSFLMSEQLVNVTAMATVPGGDPDADWGHIGPPEPPYVLPTPDEGDTEVEPDTPETASADPGGCSSSAVPPGSWWVLFGLLGLIALRRRRVS